ncbi:MAG: FecR family protein [Cyclobacteriaceae bacterium]
MDIYAIIVRKLTNKLDSTEEEYFNSWLESHPDNNKFFEQLQRYWEFNGHTLEEKKKAVWSKIHNHLETDDRIINFNRPNSNDLKKAYWVAASVVLFLLGYILISELEKEPQTAISTTVLDKLTAAGQNLTIRLPDGSQVKLNAESSISYPEIFSDSIREIHLNGEAFFEVEKDTTKPFIIHSDNIKTIVKGTSFNINAYSVNHDIEVAVESGIVEVVNKHNLSNRVLLNKHEAVAFSKESSTLNLVSYSNNMTTWKDGIITFEKASFEEITTVLQRWYGVTFDVKKEVDMGDGFVGKYEDQSLKAVIESISYAGGFSYKIENKILTIY